MIVDLVNGILECISAYVGPGKAIMLFVVVIAFAITGEMAVLDVCMQLVVHYVKTRTGRQRRAWHEEY